MWVDSLLLHKGNDWCVLNNKEAVQVVVVVEHEQCAMARDEQVEEPHWMWTKGGLPVQKVDE